MTDFEKLSLNLQLISAWAAVLQLTKPLPLQQDANATHQESVSRLIDLLGEAQRQVEAATDRPS